MACSICYEAYTKETRAPQTLICGHSFCASCVRKLNKGHKTLCCCLCRRHTVASYKRIGKNIAFIELLEKTGHLAKDESSATVKSKKEKDCCDVCNMEDEDMPIVVVADSSDDEDEDEESDQQRIFNRAIQLLYDEVFDVERALSDATSPEEPKVVKLKERLRTLQQGVDKTIETMNAAGKALNSVRKQIRELRQDVSSEGIGPVMEFRPLDFAPLRGGVRHLEDVLNFTFDEDHFFDDFNDDDVNHAAVINEDAYDDFGDDSDNDAHFMEIIDEPDIERFMQQNYLRVSDRNVDTNTITRVQCYLCDVYVEVPDIDGLQRLETHVRGLRHQQLQETNRRETIRGASNSGARQSGRQGNNRAHNADEPQYQLYGTMHINFIPNRHNDAWDLPAARPNNTSNSNQRSTSFGIARRGGFGSNRGRVPSYMGSNDRPARSVSSGNGLNNLATNGKHANMSLRVQAESNQQRSTASGFARPSSGNNSRGGRGGNPRNRRFTNLHNDYNPPARSGRQFSNSSNPANQRQSNYSQQNGTGSMARNGSSGQFGGSSRSGSQQYHNGGWGQALPFLDFSGPPAFQTPPPGFETSSSSSASTNAYPGGQYGLGNGQSTQQRPTFYAPAVYSVPPPPVRSGQNGHGRNNSWNQRSNEGQHWASAETTDRRTR
ncbi:hypothetical protein AAVH_05654 [Aphelenchoides avenae]|nr:hypothetical protein AAVH_05654 [Aphelenchus avenae]